MHNPWNRERGIASVHAEKPVAPLFRTPPHEPLLVEKRAGARRVGVRAATRTTSPGGSHATYLP